VATNKKLIRKFSSKVGKNTLRGNEKPNQSVKSNISIKDISNFKNLVAAFELIKSNLGNITKGVTPETLNVIDLDYLLTIERRLQDGKFKRGPARRIKIPKSGENITRHLTMAYLRKSLVQKAVQLALESGHEEKFRNYSHGFRPGTKPAIQFLESNFYSFKYILEADFHKAFPSIPPHNKLIDLLKTIIQCEKIISLICSGLDAVYLEEGQLEERSVSGTPQVSLLSPLLSNVYFYELDKDGILYSQGKTCRKTKEYESLENKMKY